MDPEPINHKQKSSLRTYARSWNEFIDRAMMIIVENSTEARYTLKFMPRQNHFILKVTDGQRIVMKRANSNSEYEQIQKFTILAARALTNEAEHMKQIAEGEKAGKEKHKKKKKK